MSEKQALLSLLSLGSVCFTIFTEINVYNQNSQSLKTVHKKLFAAIQRLCYDSVHPQRTSVAVGCGKEASGRNENSL